MVVVTGGSCSGGTEAIRGGMMVLDVWPTERRKRMPFPVTAAGVNRLTILSVLESEPEPSSTAVDVDVHTLGWRSSGCVGAVAPTVFELVDRARECEEEQDDADGESLEGEHCETDQEGCDHAHLVHDRQ